MYVHKFHAFRTQQGETTILKKEDRFMLRLKVKEVARAKGFSMGKLSRLADVDRSTLKLIYDRTDYNPTIGTLWRIAKILQVKLDDLVEEVSDQN